MAPAVVHVTGARPNFPKAAPVISALSRASVPQMLVHTGQHYDDQMSAVFFEQLGLPKPDVNLGVGSGSHATQTAAIMTKMEELLLRDRPDLVVVYGDVNSTVAAALTASKMGIPLAHVEAGLRSFDRSMPEEINRVVTDRLSDLLFTTSVDAVAHLADEGIAVDSLFFVGNPMIDTLLKHLEKAGVGCLSDRLPSGPYAVATLHRPGNVDAPEELAEIVAALEKAAETVPLVLPVHPRSRANLAKAGLFQHPRIIALEPLGYLEFIGLVKSAELVITDSGGVQEETTILGVPCLTLRPNTERPVTITHGTNRLTTAPHLATDVRVQMERGRPESWPVPPLWDGKAGERIGAIVQECLAN